MLITARSYAAKCGPLEFAGPLEKFKGSIDQKSLYGTLEAETDLKELTSGDKDPAANAFTAAHAYAMSCPSGRFVVYQQVRDTTHQNWLVGVNLDTKKAAVMYIQNTAFEQAGDVPTLAAMWAYRGLGIQDFSATGVLKIPPADLSAERRQIAVGYLYGVQSSHQDIVRANASTSSASNAVEAAPGEQQPTENRRHFSGEYITYPRGLTEDRLRSSFADLNCYRMNGARDDVCVGKTSLTSATIVQQLPNGGSCLVDKEFNVTMDKGKLAAVSCDIPKATADQIASELDGRAGPPKHEQRAVASMHTDHYEWKVGEDYILITHYTGQDVRGTPLDSYNLSVGTQPLRLAQ
jgi:hypothetical protein